MISNLRHTPEAPLLKLNLSSGSLAALREQGFIASEYRVRRGRRLGPYGKLRWRENRRQRTRYLGKDPEAIAEIRAALARWQQEARLMNEIPQLLSETRQALGSLREALSPDVLAAGKHWHGYRSRQSRGEK